MTTSATKQPTKQQEAQHLTILQSLCLYDCDGHEIESHDWVTIEGHNLPHEALIDLEKGGIILREQDTSYHDAFRYDPQLHIVRKI